jgi:hypothetical protein
VRTVTGTPSETLIPAFLKNTAVLVASEDHIRGQDAKRCQLLSPWHPRSLCVLELRPDLNLAPDTVGALAPWLLDACLNVGWHPALPPRITASLLLLSRHADAEIATLQCFKEAVPGECFSNSLGCELFSRPINPGTVSHNSVVTCRKKHSQGCFSGRRRFYWGPPVKLACQG